MQAGVQPQHIEPPSGLARQVDGRLNGIAAADQEQRFFEGCGQYLPQGPMQPQTRHIEHRLGGVQQRLHGFLDHVDHAGMLVTQSGPHLARLKIEICLTIRIRDRRPLRRCQNGAFFKPTHITGLGSRKHPFRGDVARLRAIHVVAPYHETTIPQALPVTLAWQTAYRRSARKAPVAQ